MYGSDTAPVMPLLEDRTASFIVRIWRETAELPSCTCEWRGSIEHVASGQRAFFRDLPAMLEYMKPHLQQLGIDVTQRFWEHMSPALQEPEAVIPDTIRDPAVDEQGADQSAGANVVGDQPCR